MADGNGKNLSDRVSNLEAEVGRCSSRLHLVERDIASNALSAAEDARATRKSVEALQREFSRFAAAVAGALETIRDERKPNRIRRLLERWAR